MNIAVGKVVRDGDDLAVRLGSATIRLHPAVASQRPALAAYVARDVAVGIRGEDMEDARLVPDAPADARLKATVSLVEALAPRSWTPPTPRSRAPGSSPPSPPGPGSGPAIRSRS